MRFTPKTEEEIQAEMLLPDGEYDFTVAKAEEKTSSSGNPMIALDLHVYRPDGGFFTVKDWVLEKFARKLRNFCGALGLMAQYEKGELSAKLIEGRSGRCIIASEKGRKKDDGSGEYPPKNVIKDYVLPKAAKALSESERAPAQTPLASDDEIPF